MRKPLFEVPNLDALSTEELTELSEVFHHLGNYAVQAVGARVCRDQGWIDLALAREKKAQGHYELLPKAYRW